MEMSLIAVSAAKRFTKPSTRRGGDETVVETAGADATLSPGS
jgi:hypothetical protein